MNILIPIDITTAMVLAGTTIAEPAAGETAWVSAGTYSLFDLRVRSTTHRVYQCVQAHTGRTALPEADGAYWADYGPTQRFAPFDVYVSTGVSGTTSMTYVLQPGFFNAVSLYGLAGGTLTVTIKDAPGGATTYSSSAELFDQAIGLYELLFTPPLQREKVVLYDLPISPIAEITLTISAGSGDPVGLGMCNIGDLRPVIGQALWGGTQYGAGAEPKTFSYIKFFDDGSTEIRRRGSATDLRGSVLMPADAAEYALATVQQVLDKPVSCIASSAPGYAYLNTIGLISGTVSAESSGTAKFAFSVRGFI